MSFSKRYLDSLPADEQDAILGAPDPDEEAAYWAAWEADCKIIFPPTGPDDYPDYGDLDGGIS